MSNTRIERDSFGPIEVPADRLWGAQTQRSLQHFRISTERMPPELIAALAAVKRACAAGQPRARSAAEDRGGGHHARPPTRWLPARHPAEFPLAVWQTGSGTQTNMNMNEVLANRASELLGGASAASSAWSIRTTTSTSASPPTTFSRPRCMWRRRCRSRMRCCRRLRRLRATLAQKSDDFRRHRQDRPHPPAGRDAADAGPGILRLRGATGACRGGDRSRAAGAVRAGRRRHRGRHRAQHPSRIRRAGRGATGAAQRLAVCQRAPTSSPRWPRTTRWWPRMAR